MSVSMYGHEFDRLAERWAAIENEHDRHHPDRGECGGIGACSMMLAGHDLETRMIDVLAQWREEQA